MTSSDAGLVKTRAVESLRVIPEASLESPPAEDRLRAEQSLFLLSNLVLICASKNNHEDDQESMLHYSLMCGGEKISTEVCVRTVLVCVCSIDCITGFFFSLSVSTLG